MKRVGECTRGDREKAQAFEEIARELRLMRAAYKVATLRLSSLGTIESFLGMGECIQGASCGCLTLSTMKHVKRWNESGVLGREKL